MAESYSKGGGAAIPTSERLEQAAEKDVRLACFVAGDVTSGSWGNSRGILPAQHPSGTLNQTIVRQALSINTSGASRVKEGGMKAIRRKATDSSATQNGHANH